MKKLISLSLAFSVAISTIIAGDVPLPEIPYEWYKSVVGATNKNVFIKENLPVYIKRYPVLAKTFTHISITNDITNKKEYISIYNNTYTNAQNDPFVLILNSNHEPIPRPTIIAPIIINTYGNAEILRQ